MQLKTKLAPHQRAAVEKLQGLRVGGLLMDMGTGKTLTLMEFVRLRQHKIDRVVYFCPVSLKETVLYELQHHIEDPSVYVFDDRTRQGRIPTAFWYIVGIESVGQSDRVTLAVNELITDKTFVVLDESDMCKNHRAVRTMRITAMSQRARYRMILTGTAVGEGVEDLYSQMYFLSPEILGYRSFYSFAQNHLEYSDKFPGLVVRHLNTDWIASKIEPYVYQVKKDECLTLPDKLYCTRYFSMTCEQKALYRRAKEEILMQAPDDELDSYTIFRLFTALREIVSGFWMQHVDPSLRRWAQYRDAEPTLLTCEHGRIKCLEGALAEIPANEKVIIWTHFHYSTEQILEAIAQQYGDESFSRYDGTAEKRDHELERWRRESRFLVASPKCGARGLTLNEAAYTIFYNNDFPYRIRQQAEDRNYRIGQDRRPVYIDLVCRDSIDERIFRALSRKENLVHVFRRELEKLKTAKQKRDRLMKI